eukprot:4685682-Amphidinium_carterae.2
MCQRIASRNGICSSLLSVVADGGSKEGRGTCLQNFLLNFTGPLCPKCFNGCPFESHSPSCKKVRSGIGTSLAPQRADILALSPRKGASAGLLEE